MQTFKGSNGCQESFRKQHNISFTTRSSEIKYAPIAKEEKLFTLIEG